MTEKELIKKIEDARSSKVLCYIAATRENLDSQMKQMDIRIFKEHLDAIGKCNKLDLILNSFGGDVTLPWRLVHLIREYTNNFAVIVPLHAFSAATLTALGADEILMLPTACLGPTDPSSTSPFNPRNATAPGVTLPINSEDLAAYLNFIREDMKLDTESGKIHALSILTQSDARIHPLAIGAVKRGTNLAKKYSKELLKLHMTKRSDIFKINKIVNIFSSGLHSHDHPINRKEAKEIGLNIVQNEVTEKLVWDLFKLYEIKMSMKEAFNPVAEFKKRNNSPLPLSINNSVNPVREEFDINLITIESANLTSMKYQALQITATNFVTSQGTQENFSTLVKGQGWKNI